ncbi:hypothetical protein QFZ67_005667 [Streptomyces sp. V1I1]|nr:hypothetical protein [Streptomyces sp. V1I1]
MVGNHLAQHGELSLAAIGLAVHIQSLPTGAKVSIKALAERCPEGEVRIAAPLRELEAHGYLVRTRERLPSGQVITRTVSYNNPLAAGPSSSPPEPEPEPEPPLPARAAPVLPLPSPVAGDLLAALRGEDPASSSRNETSAASPRTSPPGWSAASSPTPRTPHPHRRAPRGPDPPPGGVAGPPPHRTASPTAPRERRASAPGPAPELRPLRPRLPRPGPGMLPRLHRTRCCGLAGTQPVP